MTKVPDDKDQSPVSETDYEVGYKKPPKQHQFKAGNAFGKGKPKGSKNTKTLVNAALGQKVQVKIGGKPKKLTKIEMALHQLANQASQGNLKAIEKVIQLQQLYGPQDDPEGASNEKLQKDFGALKAYLAMKQFLDPSLGEGQADD